MTTCGIFTTAFDVPETVAHSYFKSLALQSYTDFDVIVVNDGFENILDYSDEYPRLNVIELECGGSIAKNREVMINHARESKYEAVIFCDFDDYFSPNRVELTLDLLQHHDLVVNDLLICSDGDVSNDGYISNRFPDNYQITLVDVLEKNFLGLSNTAIKKSLLEPVTFPQDQIAVDWLFFTEILYRHPKAVFTNKTYTYYRQHENTLAGIGRFDLQQLEKEIAVKKQHYNSLRTLDPLFEYYYREVCDFDCRIHQKNPSDYLVNLKSKLNVFPLWWELFNTNYKE